MNDKSEGDQYKLYIRYFIEDSDDGESGHYEKRVIVKTLTYMELYNYLKDNFVYDFEKLK